MTVLVPASVYVFNVESSIAGNEQHGVMTREVTIFTCKWGEAIWGWDSLFRDLMDRPVFLTPNLDDALIARIVCLRDGFELYDYSIHRLTKHKGDECTIECIKELSHEQ